MAAEHCAEEKAHTVQTQRGSSERMKSVTLPAASDITILLSAAQQSLLYWTLQPC